MEQYLDPSMQIGDELRFSHEECGDTKDRLYIKRVRGGWIYHCHNCAPACSGFAKDTSITSPSQTLVYLQALQKDHSINPKKGGRIYLPSDFDTKIPTPGLGWLYKYQISDEEIKTYNFGYSKSLNRLVLPVYNQEGDLVFYQGRNLGKVTKQNPKYINMRGSRDDIFFRRLCGSVDGDDCGISSGSERPTDCLCIVEDILSAIRVGRQLPTLAILGSYLSTSLLQSFKDYGKIIIWLDFDKASTTLKELRRTAILTGKKIVPLITKLDPKEYNDLKIKEMIDSCK